MRKGYQDIREIAGLLDETIEKAESVVDKVKERRTELRKSLSHNPFEPVPMMGDNASKYYNPYKQTSEGQYAPYPVEHWRSQNSEAFRKDPTIYRTTTEFYKQAGSTARRSGQPEPVVLLRRSLHDAVDDLMKGRGLPVGTIHEWQGQKYQKQADGQWRFVSDGKTNAIEDDYGSRVRAIKDEIKQRKDGKKPEPKTTAQRNEDSDAREKDLDEREENLKQQEMDFKQQELDAREKALAEREQKISEGEKKADEAEGKGKAEEKIDIKALEEKVKRKQAGEGGKLDLTKAELDHLLANGRYALISSGRNPAIEADKNLSDEEVETRHGQLESELKDKGFMYTDVKGHYDGEEDSFLVMVHDADKDHITGLGSQYNQDSVIFSEGGKHEMIYTTGENKGSHHPGEGHEEKPEAEDFFTVLKHPDGSETKFALNFDFDKLEQERAAQSNQQILTDFISDNFDKKDEKSASAPVKNYTDKLKKYLDEIDAGTREDNPYDRPIMPKELHGVEFPWDSIKTKGGSSEVTGPKQG